MAAVWYCSSFYLPLYGERYSVLSFIVAVSVQCAATIEFSRIFGTITELNKIPGSFLDTPPNLSLKHLLGHAFVRDSCSNDGAATDPSFVIKTEDDVFVEIFHLFKFALAIYGERPQRSLVCEVVPGREIEEVSETKRKMDFSHLFWPFGSKIFGSKPK